MEVPVIEVAKIDEDLAPAAAAGGLDFGGDQGVVVHAPDARQVPGHQVGGGHRVVLGDLLLSLDVDDLGR